MATPILMPKKGNTVEECLLAKWCKQKGDAVAVGEVIAEIETDKAAETVESEVAGVLLETFFAQGDLIPVQVAFCVIGKPGEDTAAFRPGQAAPATEAPVAAAAATVEVNLKVAATVAGDPGAPLSPRARKFVADHTFVVPADLAGSGAGGRIMEADVKKAHAEAAHLTPVAAALLAQGVPAPASGTGVGGRIRGQDMGKAVAAPAPAASAAVAAPAASAASAPAATEDGVALPQIRKIIASRLVESLQTLAQYTLNASADVTAVLALRKRIKENTEKLGLADISINDLVMFAAIKALQRHPEVNAEFIGGKIFQRRSINLGFACDTPRGLMVPVIRDAQALTLAQLAARIRERAKAAQDGKIGADDLAGGTFTISNLGIYGITSFTPVINAPQVAILGVCGLELKPVRGKDGQVTFADHLGFSLTLDHRVVDGAPGAKFLKTLREIIENFDLICVAG